MKKKAIIITALCMVLSMSLPAAAKSSSDKENNIDVNATISVTQLDFSVTPSVYAKATGEDADDPLKLSYDDLQITNNMKAGKIKVTSVKATGNGQWNVVADSAKIWKALATDSHFISIQATNADSANVTNIDLAGDGVTETVYVESNSTTNYTLSGHTGAVSEAISAEDDLTVATIVATVELC